MARGCRVGGTTAEAPVIDAHDCLIPTGEHRLDRGDPLPLWAVKPAFGVEALEDAEGPLQQSPGLVFAVGCPAHGLGGEVTPPPARSQSI